MIAGMEVALLSMKMGERAIFRVEPKYGYGKSCHFMPCKVSLFDAVHRPRSSRIAGTKSDMIRVSSRDVIYIHIELVAIKEEDLADAFTATDVTDLPARFSVSELTEAKAQLERMGKESYAQSQYSQASRYFQEVNLYISWAIFPLTNYMFDITIAVWFSDLLIDWLIDWYIDIPLPFHVHAIFRLYAGCPSAESQGLPGRHTWSAESEERNDGQTAQ